MRKVTQNALLVSVLLLSSRAPAADLAAAARAILGADQGVYVQTTDGTTLLAQQAEKPVHPASVSKIPTTLALLRKFGPDHRFTTTISGDGPMDHGTLHGNLWIAGDGNPALVDEDALLIAARLNQMGIDRVTGTLRLRNPLTFDWVSDPQGLHFAQALAGRVPATAWSAVQAFTHQSASKVAAHSGPAATPPMRISFTSVQTVASDAAETPTKTAAHILLIHRSEPLVSLLKALNDYSNNIFKPLADQAGGAAAVEALARDSLPDTLRGEVTLGDGAGTDPRNRLSPRATVQLLRALERQLAQSGHQLYDILPVAGIDAGTLHDRLNSPALRGRVVGKTGTFGDYGASALVGAIATRDRGTVYFAILNHGIAIPEARRRQDRFVQTLLQSLHTERWDYRRDERPAMARAQVLSAP